MILIKTFACILISPTDLVCVNSLSVIVRIRFRDMLLVAYLSIYLRSLNVLTLVDRQFVSQENFRAFGDLNYYKDRCRRHHKIPNKKFNIYTAQYRIFSTWCRARINYLPFIWSEFHNTVSVVLGVLSAHI